MGKRQSEWSRGGACRFGPGMILVCFAFPISDCSILFPAGIWVHLDARMWIFDIMHICGI